MNQPQEPLLESLLALENVNVFESDARQRCLLSVSALRVPKISGLGIIGLSGSGKTTLMRVLLGLLPHEGAVHFLGMEVKPDGENEVLYKRLGVLFQRAALFNDLSVRDNCVLAQELASPVFRDPGRIDDVLKRLQLWEARHRLPWQLSGGMQHRAGLARTLVRPSDCLVLDEPTTGQDAENAGLIQRLLYEYQHEHQGRLVIVSHDHEWLRPLIQWSVKVEQGRVVDSLSLT